MAIPLTTVLSAAPGIISAATEIIRIIRDRKTAPGDDPDRLQALESLAEKQALLIEEMAVSHRDMAMAVRNNRIISILSLAVAVVAGAIALTIPADPG